MLTSFDNYTLSEANTLLVFMLDGAFVYYPKRDITKKIDLTYFLLCNDLLLSLLICFLLPKQFFEIDLDVRMLAMNFTNGLVS